MTISAPELYLVFVFHLPIQQLSILKMLWDKHFLGYTGYKTERERDCVSALIEFITVWEIDINQTFLQTDVKPSQ